MNYLLDTNVLVHCLRKKGNPLVVQRLRAHAPADVAVCAIVVAELWYGAAKSQNPSAEQARVSALLAPFTSLSFDDGAARRYGALRADLQTQGLALADLDLMIAAIALVHGLTLVTHNTAHFARVPGLALEDWEVP